MISVITPTFKRARSEDWLAEAFASLKGQSRDDWEWIVLPNRGAMVPDFGDARVRIIDADAVAIDAELGVIGALKAHACAAAQGDVIVELDDDDLLAPNALERLAGTRGLSYSNFAEFKDEDRTPGVPYQEAYGWTTTPARVGGMDVLEHHAFEPSAAMMRSILFAPNHVRAWNRAEYERLGGHNRALSVADDYDLACRFYIDSEIEHVDECLYLYRLHGANTVANRNEAIQTGAAQVGAKYLQKIVARWCSANELQMIDLGAAHDKPEGYVGVDTHDADIIADLNERWPFEDNSVGAIRAVDFLEHLPDKVHALNEAHRVLAHGGWLSSGTPSSDGRGAFQDPTHVSYWNENSFWYVTDRAFAKYVPAITARFQIAHLETRYPTRWHQDHDIPYVQANLIAVKEGPRLPGLLRI